MTLCGFPTKCRGRSIGARNPDALRPIEREKQRIPRRPSKTCAGPVTPARASKAAVIPLCADHPECRNLVSVPSTRHSRSPPAKLPAIPAARSRVGAIGQAAYAAGLAIAAILTAFATATRISAHLLEILTAMFNPLPSIALLPLALIWFGLGEAV